MSGLDEAESVQPAPAQQSLPHAGAPPQKLPRLNASGLLPPNATLTVGKFRVTVERHIGRGGHSQLYHVTFHPTLHAEKSPPPVAAANEREHTRASSPTSHDRREGALKHVRISSPDHRAAVEREIAVMLQLQGHPNIVTLYDSCVLDADGLLLMEYCPQGDVLGLINRTYPNHLKAPVVLDIFFDVCRAVAHMHYQVPLLLHRDLKVENILLSTDPDTGQTRYKLCDFGSATSHLIRAGDSSSRETIALLTEDIQKHTTLEYRAPELIDFYISREVTEKVDIWALGVLLFKLCYYTTPFEKRGNLAILNVDYVIPRFPTYPKWVAQILDTTLQEVPRSRPNIYALYSRLCRIRGVDCDIEDIYNTSCDSGTASPSTLTSASLTSLVSLSDNAVASPVDSASVRNPSTPHFGKSNSGSLLKDGEIIVPMRRGRPSKPATPLRSPSSLANLCLSPNSAGSHCDSIKSGNGDDSSNGAEKGGSVIGSLARKSLYRPSLSAANNQLNLFAMKQRKSYSRLSSARSASSRPYIYRSFTGGMPMFAKLQDSNSNSPQLTDDELFVALPEQKASEDSDSIIATEALEASSQSVNANASELASGGNSNNSKRISVEAVALSKDECKASWDVIDDPNKLLRQVAESGSDDIFLDKVELERSDGSRRGVPQRMSIQLLQGAVFGSIRRSESFNRRASARGSLPPWLLSPPTATMHSRLLECNSHEGQADPSEALETTSSSNGQYGCHHRSLSRDYYQTSEQDGDIGVRSLPNLRPLPRVSRPPIPVLVQQHQLPHRVGPHSGHLSIAPATARKFHHNNTRSTSTASPLLSDLHKAKLLASAASIGSAGVPTAPVGADPVRSLSLSSATGRNGTAKARTGGHFRSGSHASVLSLPKDIAKRQCQQQQQQQQQQPGGLLPGNISDGGGIVFGNSGPSPQRDPASYVRRLHSNPTTPLPTQSGILDWSPLSSSRQSASHTPPSLLAYQTTARDCVDSPKQGQDAPMPAIPKPPITAPRPALVPPRTVSSAEPLAADNKREPVTSSCDAPSHSYISPQYAPKPSPTGADAASSCSSPQVSMADFEPSQPAITTKLFEGIKPVIADSGGTGGIRPALTPPADDTSTLRPLSSITEEPEGLDASIATKQTPLDPAQQAKYPGADSVSQGYQPIKRKQLDGTELFADIDKDGDEAETEEIKYMMGHIGLLDVKLRFASIRQTILINDNEDLSRYACQNDLSADSGGGDDSQEKRGHQAGEVGENLDQASLLDSNTGISTISQGSSPLNDGDQKHNRKRAMTREEIDRMLEIMDEQNKAIMEARAKMNLAISDQISLASSIESTSCRTSTDTNVQTHRLSQQLSEEFTTMLGRMEEYNRGLLENQKQRRYQSRGKQIELDSLLQTMEEHNRRLSMEQTRVNSILVSSRNSWKLSSESKEATSEAAVGDTKSSSVLRNSLRKPLQLLAKSAIWNTRFKRVTSNVDAVKEEEEEGEKGGEREVRDAGCDNEGKNSQDDADKEEAEERKSKPAKHRPPGLNLVEGGDNGRTESPPVVSALASATDIINLYQQQSLPSTPQVIAADISPARPRSEEDNTMNCDSETEESDLASTASVVAMTTPSAGEALSSVGSAANCDDGKNKAKVVDGPQIPDAAQNGLPPLQSSDRESSGGAPSSSREGSRIEVLQSVRMALDTIPEEELADPQPMTTEAGTIPPLSLAEEGGEQQTPTTVTAGISDSLPYSITSKPTQSANCPSSAADTSTTATVNHSQPGGMLSQSLPQRQLVAPNAIPTMTSTSSALVARRQFFERAAAVAASDKSLSPVFFTVTPTTNNGAEPVLMRKTTLTRIKTGSVQALRAKFQKGR